MIEKCAQRVIKLLPYKKAQVLLKEAVHMKPSGYEEVPVEESLGRVLVTDIVSNTNIPDQNRAVFDGYAIQSSNTINASLAAPVMLKVIGATFPDQNPSKIHASQTVFAACGAPLPNNADAVVKIENIRLHEDRIEVRSPVSPWENVALTGEDVKKGCLLMKSGCVIRPQDVGLLAGVGTESVKVIRKPRVCIISVGNELVKLNKKGAPGVVNNYALIISNLVSEWGGIPQLFGIVPDDLQFIKNAISAAARKADIVTTIAGCSVGPKDLVPDAIAALTGKGLVFHGVGLSPGKVMGVGIVKDTPVIMLPGHIVSAYAGFYFLVAPLIARYLGLGDQALSLLVSARLDCDIEAKSTATFLRLRLTYSNGEFKAEPIHGGASALTTIANSNGYIIVQEKKVLKKGTLVNVILFDRYELANTLRELTEGF